MTKGKAYKYRLRLYKGLLPLCPSTSLKCCSLSSMAEVTFAIAHFSSLDCAEERSLFSSSRAMRSCMFDEAVVLARSYVDYLAALLPVPPAKKPSTKTLPTGSD